MTDAKPDPLEELKRLQPRFVSDYPILNAAIAAWEKERAESQVRAELLESYHEESLKLIALRAAVEKVRDGLRAAAISGVAATFNEYADALDAALRGGA